MPFDGTPPVPDLSVPSLENLAYVLRHRETWPQGFVWDYRYSPSCAMGLTHMLWPGSRLYFNLPDEITFKVRTPDTILRPRWPLSMFCVGRSVPGDFCGVQPEHVAAAVDRLLARQ